MNGPKDQNEEKIGCLGSNVGEADVGADPVADATRIPHQEVPEQTKMSVRYV